MPLRSILIPSATDGAGLEHAIGSGADVVLLQLDTDADLAAAATLLGGFSHVRQTQIWVRPHPLDDVRLERELATLCPFAPDALILPRAETAADVQHLGALLAVREAEAGLTDGSLKIVAEMETAGALFELHRVARASDRLVALGWNGEALARDLDAEEDRDLAGRWIDPLQTARTLLLAACADARLAAIDSPFSDVDPETFRGEATRAARDGFAGKFATSASQVAAINVAFAARG